MSEKIQKTETKVRSIEEKIRKLDLQLAREKSRLKEQKRKARTKKLIEIGGLTEIAGISNVDKAALLGAMVQMKELLEDKQTFNMFRKKGEELLSKRK
ncbi:conjugal transfer protein TraD [Pleurocapsales cyanobacterium LEGE 10410]|nr:conjugal transfer protein TraD [Pleurocapsales cyanobacterium LEGE 10410]